MTKSTQGASEVVVYTVNVTVTRPVRSWDHEVTLADAKEWMVSPDARKELERELLLVLRKLDGDCDVECIEVQEAQE